MKTQKTPKPLIACCYRSGQILFRTREPEGMISLGRSMDHKRLRAEVSVLARLAYDNKTMLVPGLPEASTDNEALDAAWKFAALLRERANATDPR